MGITYRQLDYWARTGLLRPSITDATGSGSQRRYSYGDVLELKVIKRLLDAGLKLQQARQAVECLRGDLGADLASAQLVLAGTRSVLAHSDGEIVDLLAGGQGVFNILPLSGVVSELDAAIVEIASERHRPSSGTPGRHPAAGYPAGTSRWSRPRWSSVEARLRGDSAAPGGPSPVTRRFAHESEQRFARILDFYGVQSGSTSRWSSHWSGTRPGARVSGFRPDFWLPEPGLFVELTTLNQRLVTKKNGKVRRLAQLYPDVRVTLLYQRDTLDLLAKYGLAGDGAVRTGIARSA